MGSMIMPDAYISDAILARKPGYETLARIARAQVVTGNRTGHIFSVNGLAQRIGVLRNARLGRLPKSIVACSRCGCQAFLLDWVAACELSPLACKQHLVDLSNMYPAWRLAFMRRCPGASDQAGELSILDAAIVGRW